MRKAVVDVIALTQDYAYAHPQADFSVVQRSTLIHMANI